MNSTYPGCHHKSVCQDVRHAVQERDCGKIGFWAVGGIVETRVECWAKSKNTAREVDDEAIDNEF